MMRLIVILLLASPASARDTCTLISLKDDYKRAAVVMLGEALEGDVGVARFKVIRVWKGDVKQREVTFDATQLQRRFEPGRTVLVFAYRSADIGLYMHDCSHTNPVTAEFVARSVETISSRSWWWNCPISSLSLRRRQDAP